MNQPYKKLTIFSWSLYDFANQPFTTLIVTFIYGTYFTQVVAENEIIGMALWSRAITITGILVALLSPIMGAMADRGGFRKLFLILWTWVSILGSLMLYKVLPGSVIPALFWFILANVGFEMGGVFCNAYLPDIAPQEKIGRISGYGWSIGYVGGLLALGISYMFLIQPETPWFGFTKDQGQNIRATTLLVAIWFAVFSLPTFIWVRENSDIVRQRKKLFSQSFRQMGDTFREIKRYKNLVRFLIARLIYNDGLITIFAFGGIFAAGTFHFTMSEIFIFGIVLNITAGMGAFAMGFLDDILGGKKTIQISLVGLIIAVLLAILTSSKAVFWLAGILIGIFAGPNQASSRSLMARFVPKEKENEFFGFFAFSGKATAFMGPFLLGVFTNIFESQRAGIAVVLFFLILGSFLLVKVDEKEGMEAAGNIVIPESE
ncbi:MAG: MFS transporter [Candidatus Marinimicrobia bacterium]|nr:MFS transporter [Candidatus Neomarinimicrobiota bacterium]